MSRCRGGRIAVSVEHNDFPAMLAEALDTLEVYALELKAASSALGCTPSQLTKLLKAEPRALGASTTVAVNSGAPPDLNSPGNPFIDHEKHGRTHGRSGTSIASVVVRP